MQKAQITKAMKEGTEVAVAKYLRQDEIPTAYRAVIVSLGNRRTYSVAHGRSYTRKSAEDGIRVRFLDDVPEYDRGGDRPIVSVERGGYQTKYTLDNETGDRIVRSAQILDTWVAYSKRKSAADERKGASKRSREQSEQRHKAAEAALRAAGVEARASYRVPTFRCGDLQGAYTGVTISAADAERFAALLQAETSDEFPRIAR